MKKNPLRFVIVDDDPQNNSLSKMILKRALGKVKVFDFVNPELGLKFIEEEFEFSIDDTKTILFLDINMFMINGWEFLERFGKFSDVLKNQFSIYILSSSIDNRDTEKAKSIPLILDFIEKPLKVSSLLKMFGEYCHKPPYVKFNS